MFDRIRLLLINFTLKHLLNAVRVQDIVTYDKKSDILYVNKKPLTVKEKAQLKNEAEYFTRSRLWGLLVDATAHEAEKKLFIHSLTILDSVSGKTMLYNTDIQKKIVDICKNQKVN